MATTWPTIRNAYTSAIVSLTPAVPNGKGRTFVRCPLRYELRKWATEVKGEQVFRRFEFTRTGAATNAGHCAPDEERIQEPVTLTVAYPLEPIGFYGKNEIDDVEKVIRADAQQLKDTLFSPGNYTAGQSIVAIQVAPIDKSNPDVWFQQINATLVYVIAQNLSF